MNQVPKQVVVLAAVLAMGCFVVFAQLTGSYTLLSLSFIVPFSAMLLPRMHLLGAAAILFQYSLLKIPFMPFNLLLHQVAMLLFIGVCIVSSAMRKQPVCRPAGWHFSLTFLFVVLITMYVRGFGLLALGGDTVAGAAYIHLFAAMGFYHCSGMLIMKPQQWRFVLVGMSLIVLYPVFAQYMVLAGVMFPLYFTEVSYGLRMTYFALAEGVGGDVRYAVLGVLRYFMIAPVFFFKSTRRRWLLTSMFFAVALIGALASGTRLFVMQVLMFASFYMMVISKRKSGVLIIILGLGIFIWVFAYVIIDFIPFAFQRALTILPGIETQGFVTRDAEGTIRWRQILWELAWLELPQYLLVGQGLAIRMDDIIRGSYAMGRDAWVYHALLTGDLHLGPLAVLYTFGIPGFVAVLALVVAFVRRHLQLCAQVWQNEDLKRYHQAMMTLLAVNGVIYMISGSARHILPALFLQFATLHALWMSDQSLASEKGRTSVPEDNRNMKTNEYVRAG